ncbi:MAG: cytochrome c, partial [Pseudomonadales bacterium]|nr:cytochrome c [Pseudomonadales bacterium]
MNHKILIPSLTTVLFPVLVAAQPAAPGEENFALHCARCHGGDARGGEFGPNILLPVSARSDQELAAYLRVGNSAEGMPPFALPDETLFAITSHVRSLFTADDQAENKPRGVLRLVGGTQI